MKGNQLSEIRSASPYRAAAASISRRDPVFSGFSSDTVSDTVYRRHTISVLLADGLEGNLFVGLPLSFAFGCIATTFPGRESRFKSRTITNSDFVVEFIALYSFQHLLLRPYVEGSRLRSCYIELCGILHQSMNDSRIHIWGNGIPQDLYLKRWVKFVT